MNRVGNNLLRPLTLALVLAGWQGSAMAQEAAAPVIQVLPLLDELPRTAFLTGGDPSGYRAVPVRLRSLRVQPRVAVEGGYDNNVRAQANDPLGSPMWRISPQVSFNNGDAVNQITGYAQYTMTRYTRARSENFGTFNSFAQLSRQLDPLNGVKLYGGVNRKAIDRTDIDNQDNTLTPVRYWQFLANGDVVRADGPWGARLSVGLDRKLFDAAVDRNTRSPIPEATRSNSRYDVLGVVTHKITPQIEAVVQVEGNARRYDRLRPVGAAGQLVSADSVGYDAMAGVNIQFNRRLFGTVRAGYMAQDFRDAAFADISGVGFKADLLYILTPRSNLRLSAQRRIDESSSAVSIGRRRLNAQLTYTHWVMPRWKLELDGNFDQFDYGVGGRKPYGYGGELRSNFLLNRALSLTTQASFYQRRAGLTSDRYKGFTVLEGMELAF
jgi:hypothetical protein